MVIFLKIIKLNNMGKTLEIFKKKRTEIISKMLDNPDENGIYSTTECFDELDKLFSQLVKKECLDFVLFCGTDKLMKKTPIIEKKKYTIEISGTDSNSILREYTDAEYAIVKDLCEELWTGYEILRIH